MRRLALAAAALLLVMMLAAGVRAAEPTPSAGAGGDPRSSGQGPGLVGEPAMAIAVVAVIGGLALGATLIYVRVTGGPRRT